MAYPLAMRFGSPPGRGTKSGSAVGVTVGEASTVRTRQTLGHARHTRGDGGVEAHLVARVEFRYGDTAAGGHPEPPGIVRIQHDVGRGRAFENRRRRGRQLVAAEHVADPRSDEAAVGVDCLGHCFGHWLGHVAVALGARIAVDLHEMDAGIAARQRTAHLLLELEHRLVGVPPRGPHVGNHGAGLPTGVEPFHGVRKRRLRVHGCLGFMHALVCAHRRATTVAVGLAGDLGVGLDPESGARRHVGEGCELRGTGGRQ